MWNWHQKGESLTLLLTLPKPRQKGLHGRLKPPPSSTPFYTQAESQPRKSAGSANRRERREDDCGEVKFPTRAAITGGWGQLQICQVDTYLSNG